jgi:hypothetical protein
MSSDPNLSQPAVAAYFDGHGEPEWPPSGPLIVVNPDNVQPTGVGSPNEQQYQTGHTNNVRTDPSAEQGEGVGPERQWPHYPHVDQPNPFRNLNVMQRSGGDSYSPDVYRPEVAAFWGQALINEEGVRGRKQTSPVAPVSNQAPSVPYVEVLPVFPGGY